MEWNEFSEALKKVLDTGDVQLAKKLEKIAKEKNNPYYFFWLGNMFDPVPQEFIDNAIKRREAIQLKMMAEHVPCEILDNL